MKKALCLLLSLLAFACASPAGAGEKRSYPAKSPVLVYELPEGWEAKAEEKDGSVTLGPKSGRVSIHLGVVPVAASLEVFGKMLPELVKAMGMDAKQTEKPEAHNEDGLDGFIAEYTVTVGGKPAKAAFALLKGGAESSVLATLLVLEPETLPEADEEALEKFEESVKGAAK